MDYVGIDYSVDLECTGCGGTTRVRYSRLLTLLEVKGAVACAACGRAMKHDWTTVAKAQQLFREHLDRAHIARRIVHRPRRAY